MTELMPLKRVVVHITHEAPLHDPAAVRRAVKSWHNRLGVGSIPRYLVKKVGRELFLDLEAWERWLAESERPNRIGSGRPRTNSFGH